MLFDKENTTIDKEKDPYKYTSYLYGELHIIMKSIRTYEEEINDIKKNNYKKHFSNFIEIDPIHEILTETMTLSQYI
jgi:hypothetical protein